MTILLVLVLGILIGRFTVSGRDIPGVPEIKVGGLNTGDGQRNTQEDGEGVSEFDGAFIDEMAVNFENTLDIASMAVEEADATETRALAKEIVDSVSSLAEKVNNLNE